jgi:hypothetical protein
MRKIGLLSIFIFLISGCAFRTVRQVDIDAWKDVPVIALDTHSLFITVPMVRTITDQGIEIRDYVNKVGYSSCAGSAGGMGSRSGFVMSYGNFSSFQSCTARMVGCDNIFYIRDGIVIQYKPVGQCYTDESLQPEQGWERFTKQRN